MTARADVRGEIAVYVDKAAADDRRILCRAPIEYGAKRAVGEGGEAIFILDRI